jgi:thymidylate synthase
MYISAPTLDDLLKQVLEAIMKNGETVSSSRGKNRELRGTVLKLTNPRARLSHSEKRGIMFSPLGELAWYLAQSNHEDFIAYYIPRYSRDAEEDQTIHGAYGPRMFGAKWNEQFSRVAELLRGKPSTRRAVIQIYDSQDLLGTPKEVPCTISLQFLIRNKLLELVVSMRSNDAFMGLPHDVFSFTMLQEIMARTVGCEIGQYIHFAGSLHLYEEHYEDAECYTAEGWQATEDAATAAPMARALPRRYAWSWESS